MINATDTYACGFECEHRELYSVLKRIAQARLKSMSPMHSWNATALVHEAFLRLAKSSVLRTDVGGDRRKFFAAISETMRHVIIDYCRRKSRIKHGGNVRRADVDINMVADPRNCFPVFEFDEALSAFELEHPEYAEIVRLKLFLGMSLPECAQAMEISIATAERWWRFSRAWLAAYLDGGQQ